MSEPNERPIEKLLKAAGEKRRREAGQPELHPATREILRTAVRREYGPAPKPARRRLGWGFRLVPKVAVLFALGVCTWLLVFKETDDEPRRLAFQEAAVPASTDKEEQPEFPQAMSSRVVSSQKVGVELADDSAVSLAAPSLAKDQVQPAPVGMRPDASRRRELAQDDSRSVVGGDYLKSDRQGIYMGTAAAEAETPQEVDTNAARELAALMKPQLASKTPALTPSTSAVGGLMPSPVLQNFTVVNDGGRIEIIDADGSTYEGSLEPVETVASMPAASGAMYVRDAEQPTDTTSPGGGPWNGVVLLNYNFVASGTNHRLGQAVQIEGNLALTERQVQLGRNVFSNTLPPSAGWKAERLPAGSERFNNGRLQGTAVLEEGRGVPVDAVPATR